MGFYPTAFWKHWLSTVKKKPLCVDRLCVITLEVEEPSLLSFHNGYLAIACPFLLIAVF